MTRDNFFAMNLPSALSDWIWNLKPLWKFAYVLDHLLRIDILELPLAFCPWIKEIGPYGKKVLGEKPYSAINPKWDPKLFVEVDTSLELKQDIDMFDQEGNLLHSQKAFYKKSIKWVLQVI